MGYSKQGYLKFIMFFQFHFGILKQCQCMRARVCVCVWVCMLCTRVTAADENCKWNLTGLGQSKLGELQLRSAPGLARTGLVMRHEVLRSLHKSTLSTCNSCSTHRHTCSYTHAYQRGGEVREGGPFACPSNRKCQSCMLLHQHYFLYLYPYSYPSISAHLRLHLCAMP